MQIVGLSRDDFQWVIGHGPLELFDLAGFRCAAWMSKFHKPGFYVATGLSSEDLEKEGPAVLEKVLAAYKVFHVS